ncbi:exocyst complex component 2 [Acrasis kona]|uniref:Exocyst complex component n=1 Tax=Acrasis kona TaxID=1008807 RepID=A0AAW2YXT2_9EUKA
MPRSPKSDDEDDDSSLSEDSDEEQENEEKESSSSSDSDVDIDDSPERWKNAAKIEKLLEERKALNHNKESEEANNKREQEVEDPLGLINGITKNNIKQKKGLNPVESDFNAALYLASFHANAKHEVFLGRARKNVSDKQYQQKKDSKSFFKRNVGKFVSTKDTLEDIFLSEDSLPQARWVAGIDVSYRDLQRMSQILFTPMIATSKKGKELQNMSTLIEKLRFVLNIPQDISEGIEREEYKRVVNEYRKAKILMADSKQYLFITMFKKIKDQIRSVVDKLFHMLKLDLPYEEKQRIVGYLAELDPPEDPSWFFLKNQCACVNRLLTECLDSTETIQHHYYPSYQRAADAADSLFNNEVYMYDDEEDGKAVDSTRH